MRSEGDGVEEKEVVEPPSKTAKTNENTASIEEGCCVICKKQATVPILLPCGKNHIVCTMCAFSYIQENKFVYPSWSSSGMSFTSCQYCPHCKSSTHWYEIFRSEGIDESLRSCKTVQGTEGSPCPFCEKTLDKPILDHLDDCEKFVSSCPLEKCKQTYRLRTKCQIHGAGLRDHVETSCTGYKVESLGLDGLNASTYKSIYTLMESKRNQVLDQATIETRVLLDLLQYVDDEKMDKDRPISLERAQIIHKTIQFLQQMLTSPTKDGSESKLRKMLGMASIEPEEEEDSYSEIELKDQFKKVYEKSIERHTAKLAKEKEM